MIKKEAPFRGNYIFTGYITSLSDITPPCNLRVQPKDPFQTIKSIEKRRMWIFLHNVHLVGNVEFFKKEELARILGLSNAVAGRLLYSLKQDGIIEYKYYQGQGYCLEFVKHIEYDNYNLSWACPFGFKSGSYYGCERCLFLDQCQMSVKKMGGTNE